MIQDLLTYTIVTVAFIHLLYGVFKMFFVKEKNQVCGNCSGGCDHVKDHMIKNEVGRFLKMK